jgi:phosphoglycolate phosphatase-like HAD superfamily hydrolase
MEKKLTGIITDIDDTLIPWEPPHAKAYPAMAQALSEASGLPYQTIVENIQQVNTAHGTIEYTALVQEMECFRDLPKHRIGQLIRIAIDSKKDALADLTRPFEDIELLLETLRFNQLVLLALSDAPKNMAYLRLKKAGLLKYFDLVIGTESPSDEKFAPQFRMEDKPFLVPTACTPNKKPHVILDHYLDIGENRIGREYAILGNSNFSDQGEAQSYGMDFYHSRWDKGTDEQRKLLLQFAPLAALEEESTESAKTAPLIHPGYQKIEVFSPREMLEEMRRRGQIK